MSWSRLDDPQTHHLQDYEARYASFRWEDIYDEFDWAKTGKVNMAHEAIDRHLTRGRRNKLALIYTDKEHTERFTFEDMSLQSNRFANVLRKLGSGKGRPRVRVSGTAAGALHRHPRHPENRRDSQPAL